MAKEKQELDTRPKEKTPTGWGKFWSTQMSATAKRLKKFTRQGNIVNTRFLSDLLGGQDGVLDDMGDRGDMRGPRTMKLNFFHTNIQTLSAQLYGSVPKVDVSREFQDPSDDVGRVAAVLLQRILQAEVESSGEEFPTALRSALQDRLLPGMGVCRVRYEFDTEEGKIINPQTRETEVVETITNEEAPIDYVHWQDFRWGWCRVWSELPWCAFRAYLTKEAVIERFGEKIAGELTYTDQSPSGMDEKDNYYDKDQTDNIQTAQIWEIWSKKDRKVFWWSEGAPAILDMKEDPLQLDGFWPMPRPLMANLTTSIMTPKADYVFAQDLYNEIDNLGTRIANITQACKVIGVYDSSTGDSVGRMMEEGTENVLIPVENWAVLGEKGGLAGVIDWMPIEDIAKVLSLLNGQLEATKNVLYEVTGMSDIVNGGKTDEYTSDGTNRLKAKFGSIKIQSFQDEFARFASDLESIKAEIIAKHFSPETIAQQSSAQFLPQTDHDKIEPAIALIQSPQIKWRVNIKPESISLADYAELQSERVQYLTAVGSFLQSATPIIEAEPATKPMMLEMLKFGLSAFKGSDYMEGMFDKMIDDAAAEAQEPQEADPAAAAEQAKSQADLAKIEAKKAADIEVANAKSQFELQKIQVDNQADVGVIQAKGDADSRKIMEELQADMKIIMAKLQADMKVEEAQSTFSIAEKEVELRNQLTLLTAEHQRVLNEIEAQKEADEEIAEENSVNG